MGCADSIARDLGTNGRNIYFLTSGCETYCEGEQSVHEKCSDHIEATALSLESLT